MVGAAVLRITKLCAPQCLDYERVQVSRTERACLSDCVKGFHNANEATMHFFRDFESQQRDRQRELVLDLADEVANDKKAAQQEARQ